jgi:hypothetical protein
MSNEQSRSAKGAEELTMKNLYKRAALMAVTPADADKPEH